jgi:hypothetical protein
VTPVIGVFLASQHFTQWQLIEADFTRFTGKSPADFVAGTASNS